MLPFLVCASLALLAPAAGPDEFAEQLTRLAAPRAAERAAAERWLEAHLARERYPELAEAALAGDAEVRGRLTRVLSSDARHLGLALGLCAEKDPGLAELGREALRAGVARFDPSLGESPVRGSQLGFFLKQLARASPPRNLRLDATLSLEEMVEVLECSGEVPLGLTFDPRLATKTIRRDAEPLGGPWEQVLARIVNAMGVAIEGHGLAPARAEDARPGFLRLAPESEATRSGVEVLVDWLLILATSAEPAARARAASNLASSGFAPALEWMDELVLVRDDAAARQGLLRAAVRGRVARALSATPLLDSLLAEAAAGGPRSARILCALSRVPCFDSTGAALAPHLLADFAHAAPRARWTRLVLLEQTGCAVPALASAARALLADPGTPARLRLQALHTLAGQAGSGAVAPTVVQLDPLVRLGLDGEELERLGRSLRALGLEPPYAEPAALPADWSARARLDLCELWLWNGSVERIAPHLLGWLDADARAEPARGETLADMLRHWIVRGEGARVAAVLARASALRPERAGMLERVRLLLGCVPPAQVAEVLARRAYALSGPTPDLAMLAALAGYPAPIPAEGAARQTLLAQLSAALRDNRSLEASRPLLRALEGAAQGLYAARRDEQGDAFSKSVRTAIRGGGKGEVRRLLERDVWPGAPGVEERDLLRELARFEVPADL